MKLRMIASLFALLTGLFHISAYGGLDAAFVSGDSKGETGETGQTGQKKPDLISVTPQLAIGEDSLQPAITFTTETDITVFGKSASLSFDLLAVSKKPLSDPSELAHDFALEGGDINLALGLKKEFKFWETQAQVAYSLFSGDELVEEGSSSIDVESEITSFRLNTAYKLNDVKLTATLAYHQATDNLPQSEFTNMLDDKLSWVFGVALPITLDGKNLFLRLQRAEVEELNDPEIRISIQTKI